MSWRVVRRESVVADPATPQSTLQDLLYRGRHTTCQLPQAPEAQPIFTATQAARDLLGSAQAQSQCLASQRALPKRRKGRGQSDRVRQLLPCVQQVGTQSNERSVLAIDSRDKLIQSPLQGWLVASPLVDGQLVRSPNAGYHMNLFYMRTLNGFKFILVGSMTSYGTVPCAKWDALIGKVLAHKAFQPFRWPLMTDDSPMLQFQVSVQAPTQSPQEQGSA